MIIGLQHVLSLWTRPALDALWFGRHLPWTLRWRLLGLQAITTITNLTLLPRYLFRRPFTVDYIPVAPGRTIRALVFRPGPESASPHRLRPLHVDCHAGGFIGGSSESSAPFCERVSRETGAIVVALTHRFAPVHPFPAAVDDVDAAVAWLRRHATSRYGADPELMTVSGFSAGANLVLAATQAPACHAPAGTAFKAAVTFYAPVDLRTPQALKRMPPDWTRDDPMKFLMPLYDSYAGPMRSSMGSDPRMSPALAAVATLPARMLLVVPKFDIVAQEQLEFAKRVQLEYEAKGETAKTVEVLWLDDLFHGFLELPDIVIPRSKKDQVYSKAIAVIQAAHEDHGWHFTSNMNA